MTWFQPKPLMLPAMLALNAEHLGAKPALIVDDETLNWAEFTGRCAAVAGALAASGLTRGDRVGIVMDNAAETVAALFGCVYGGFVAVPINVSVADAAIGTMLDDSDARAVICNGAHTARVDALRHSLDLRALVSVQPCAGWLTFSDWVGTPAAMAAPADVTPTDECNIIYSSGTTGLPKGIVHDHRCRAAWAYDMAVALRYHPGALTLCSLGLYSNISWVAMLATILAGGTLVVARTFDASACIEQIARLGITHSAMVPVQLQRMLADPTFAADKVRSLQSLMCCGSPLAPVVKQQIVDQFGSAFMELYGLTEGLVTVLQPEQMATKLKSVGQPCPGQQIVILDNDDAPCAVGQSGEIVGRGPLQMAGYHARDEANAAATWVDPHGVRWLRTGDIGYLDEDGFLYLVDRKKDMIISGGQNIYPADIEAVIAAHPLVRETAVIGVASERWGETPFAVIVGDIVDEAALIAWVNERVGKQQRIAGVQVIDELPRNPNGKVLKRSLRERFKQLRL
ncbi:MAG: class I adenylate-forming enzyme family protein [Pseudomonadota bacterium]